MPNSSHPGQPAAFYCASNYNPEDSAGYMMRRIINAVSMEVERQFEPSGLTNAQWKPLFKLYMGEAHAVAGLARECHLDAAAMTRLLDRLEAKGLCQRLRSQEDRRVVNLELTEAGREAAKEIPVVLSRVQNAYLAGFTQEEFEALKGFLRRILANAEAWTTSPALPDEAHPEESK